MKTLILILSLALGLYAHAEGTGAKPRKMSKTEFQQFFRSLKMEAGQPILSGSYHRLPHTGQVFENGSEPVLPTPHEPIRHARVKANITKVVFKQHDDGSYSVMDEPVCLVQLMVPVYDLRDAPVGPINGPLPSTDCETTINGTPATVGVGGDIALIKGRIFPDEPRVDQKVSWLFLSANSNGTFKSASAVSISRDLNQTSIIKGVNMDGLESICEPTDDGSGDITCTPIEGEFFQALTEIIDQP